jgi:NAD(P)-dependent dehydrogenase (short-subunit alcohol dehydrogenase family)
MSKPGGIRVFDGAVAVITGGASGIGRALGEALGKRGCEVILADLQASLAEEAAVGIRASGGKAVALELDVTHYAAVERVVQETYTRCGRLDYMFNNAGIGIGGELRDLEVRDWEKIIDVNFRGVVYGVQAAYPMMVRQGFGHIVNTASLAGLTPWGMLASYAATKHAVVGLSKSLRIEATLRGVRVSVLCPGAIRTSILDRGGRFGRFVGDPPKEGVERFWKRFRPMEPDKFARQALRQVARNEPIIIVPSSVKLIWWLDRLSPKLGIALGRSIFRIALKDFGTGHQG